MNFSSSDCDIFFTTQSIPLRFGGLTRAMFRRAHVFANHFENTIRILTFKYKVDLEDIYEYLEQEGFVNEKVVVINMYDFFSKYNFEKNMSNDTKSKLDNVYNYDFSNLKYSEVINHSNNQNDRINKIEYFMNDNVVKIEEYNKFGSLIRLRNYRHGNLHTEFFFREDQSVYMIKKFNDAKVETIKLLDNEGTVVKEFSDHRPLQKYFLELLIDDEKTTYLINDGRAIDDLIIEFNSRKTKKIFVIHSIHLRPPYDTFSTLRSGNRYLFEHIGQADSIVFLTNWQKDDVSQRFGERPTYSVIPHFIDESYKADGIEKKINNRFVVISRFHEEKQIDHIIKAFHILDNDNIAFKLDIYGTGKEKKVLEDLINKYSLQEKVKIHGFTNNPSKEFANSMGSFLTSKYEGFGLTVLESLINGCPVFAYDIKYGPSDMIKDGYNGYLIEPNNINDLANAIKKFINLSMREKNKLFTNAVKSTVNFREDFFVERWKQTLEQADYYSQFRYNVTKRDNIRNKLECIKFENGNLYIKITSASVNPKYNRINKDLKAITIEINNNKWGMTKNKSKSTDNFITYELNIPLEFMKNNLDADIEYSIYYYVNLDDVIYKNVLKHSSMKEYIYPKGYKIYSLSQAADKEIKFKKFDLQGINGLINYLKCKIKK